MDMNFILNISYYLEMTIFLLSLTKKAILWGMHIYNSSINDYSEYLINKQLEGIIELYFNDYILKEKFRDK